MIFSDLLKTNINSYPNQPALASSEESLTWNDLHQRATALAAYLRQLGLRAGAKVALYSQCSIGYGVAVHAAAWGGHVLVPLNTRLAAKELIELLEDCQASLILVDSVHEELTHDWPEQWQQRIVPLANDGKVASNIKPVPQHQGSATDIVTLLYTGGTTGKSKGVELSSKAMIANASAVADKLALTANDSFLLTAPLFHVSGAGMIWAAALRGTACVSLPTFSPGAVLKNLMRFKISNLFLAPVMIQMILDDPSFKASAFNSVNNLLYGASPITVKLLQRVLHELPNIRLTQAYGQTEICPLTMLDHDDHLLAINDRPELLKTAGKPIAGVELEILDVDLKPVKTGAEGEIYARSNSSMTGYYQQPELTADTLQNGWVRTGDIGCMSDDGYLTIVDRAKDMIISGGENVYSTEVESTLASHPSVSQVAIIGLPDEKWGEKVHAVIVPAATVEASDLISWCRQSLAGYKCPKSIDFIDAMPLTSAGKIDKKVLRLAYQS